MSRDSRFLLLSIFLPILAVLATVPFVATGYADDVAFSHMTRRLAETGHFAYNGWESPIMGFQIVWGALFTRLFGYSHNVLVWSALPFVAGTGAVLYTLARAMGIRELWALFFSTAVTLSPWFLAVAPSFMTDIPSLFFQIAALWCFMSALPTSSEDNEPGRRVVVWIVVGSLLGLLGGTIRQMVWLVPFIGLPFTLWVWRGRAKPLLPAVSLCLLGGLVFALPLNLWFEAQPYVAPVAVGDALVKLDAQKALTAAINLGLTLVLQGLPVFAVCAVPLARHAWASGLSENSIAKLTALLLVPACVLFLAGTGTIDRDFAWPFWSGSIDSAGAAPQLYHGMPSPLLPTWAQWLVLLLITALATAASHFGIRALIALFRPLSSTHPLVARPRETYLLVFALVDLLVSLVLCFPQGQLDRYAFPNTILVALLFLRRFVDIEESDSKRVLPIGVGICAAGAFLGVVLMQDLFASIRAWEATVTRLTAAGIPRNRISSRFESDAWYQLEQEGYLNKYGIKNPPGAFRRPTRQLLSMERTFSYAIPSIDPQVFILKAKGDTLRDIPGAAPVPYTSLLPPFQHTLYIQQR